MSATTESADADTTEEDESDNDERTTYAQVTQHPETTIVGEEIVEMVTSASIDSDQEKTGTGVGIVYRNPTVVGGTVWKQTGLPEGFDSAAEWNEVLKTALADEGDWVNGVEVEQDEIDDAVVRIDAGLGEDDEFDSENAEYRDYRLPVDYKVVDEDDREAEVQSAEFQGETVVTGVDVGGGSFNSERVDEFVHDEIMVWYGGISGQFILRALDFNGRPSARFKEDGYLVKGLFQHPLGWFDRDTENYGDLVETTDRSNLARSADRGGLGRPPRVARPPVLRSDIEDEEVFIEIGRYNGGDMLEATIAFNDFEGGAVEEATQIEMAYEQEPEEILKEEFDVENTTEVYDLYHGDGWQPEPDNAGDGETDDTSGGSFDVDVDTGDDDSDDDGITEDEQSFGQMVAENIAGSDATPDMDIFTVQGENTDLEGLVGDNADQFSETPDIDNIREVIYENASHLDVEDL